MLIVFFETKNGSYAEKVAEFETEEMYMAFLPALEKEAEKEDMIVTESIQDHVVEQNIASILTVFN